jgi:L-seryl-tRNA(Ser) seleniumtransferase
MARALRLDKTAMAALHATIVAHASDPANLPLQQMANVSIEELRARARELAAAMGWSTNVCVRATRATIGGGSLPGDTIESVALVVPKPRARSVDALARRLRLGTPSVVARVHDDELWLDLRTVDPSEMSALQSALSSALGEPLTDPS